MESVSVSRELAMIRERTAKLVIASVAIHLVAGFFILTMDTGTTAIEDDYLVTEITWLDPVQPSPAIPVAVAEPAVERNIKEELPATVQKTNPVILPAATDRAAVIAERLASLRGDQASRRVVTDAASANPALRRNSLLASFIPGAGSQATDLARSGRETLAPAPKTPAPIHRAAVAVTDVARNTVPVPEASTIKQEISQEISPGVSLAGPVSDRALLSFGTPTYPEWAKRDGVEVTVALFFTVLPNGRVKENVMIEKTSGYQDFDQRARSSLLSWLFETLGDGATSEQWGRIEFNYRLKQAG